MSRNALAGVSFSICLVLTVITFRSCDWISARSIFPASVMATKISEPIRHPRLLKGLGSDARRESAVFLWLLLLVCHAVHLFARLCCDSIPTFSSSVDDWIYFSTHSAETRLVCHLTYTMQHVVYRLYKNNRLGVGATVCIYVLLESVVIRRLRRRFILFFFV